MQRNAIALNNENEKKMKEMNKAEKRMGKDAKEKAKWDELMPGMEHGSRYQEGPWFCIVNEKSSLERVC